MPKESLQAFVFPGQGVQKTGMGAELLFHENPDVARSASRTYEEADDTLRMRIKKASLTGAEQKLAQPGLTEPVILTASIAALRILRERGMQADVVAGHSLGEYSALVAAEAISFEQALRLVRARGLMMEGAGKINPGGMSAVFGLSLSEVERICEKSGAEIANINTQNQIVISGRNDSVTFANTLAAERKGKSIKLKVTVASHSSLMKPVTEEMERVMADEPISDLSIPLVMNLTADYAANSSQVSRELIDQPTGRVLWLDTIRRLSSDGVGHFIDVGPGDILKKMINKIDPSLQALTAREIIK
ncbi:MAG: ACP S-malonyltransferase [Candidatus Levybacteria bacterium]|nr:ACP S-malonyltransferase [Candidatus Levybacteria bacterium]